MAAAPRDTATVEGAAGPRGAAARRVRMVPGGPVLVEGPVEVVLEDGRTVTSDRFLVALCACRRSRSYPFCDTSHRRRVRTGDQDGDQDGGQRGDGDV
ncbi:CDGSH iron-sulfur domain-containing protein [Actinomadura livida]|uniref:CDGSH-type Zn-finger protein n=1 Tax=Actinomadura livida TaxID=79909 RepID=A0A7W7IE38_9ACTN|nr:CDGSH-type Zn-finger protein [Actinomadura catellatispora]GGT89619.1 hypothetical protein GCM10010208_10500 [Actinomadura livida]